MEDLTGQVFGGYELKELVGTGGMASIYKGYDSSLSRWVAIKVIPIQASSGEAEKTILERFRLEAQAIAALAFGTVTPSCDLIVGPGNKWVTAAKKHLFGEVGIDAWHTTIKEGAIRPRSGSQNQCDS